MLHKLFLVDVRHWYPSGHCRTNHDANTRKLVAVSSTTAVRHGDSLGDTY
eukprot:m.516881 g.516881  ORF g.516881 m.516881 type:complete len:50 (+) comp21933_c0_seq10:1365-1514(+)